MVNFRILHFKDRYTQDTSPSPPLKKKNNNTDQGGVVEGATMMLNSSGVSAVHKKV